MDKFEIDSKARVVYIRRNHGNDGWAAGAIVTIYALEDLRPEKLDS